MLQQLTCSECQPEKGKRQGAKVKSAVYVKPGASPYFSSPAQFTITVMGGVLTSSSVIANRKRWPSVRATTLPFALKSGAGIPSSSAPLLESLIETAINWSPSL